MPRSLREQWGELSKFMTRVKVSRGKIAKSMTSVKVSGREALQIHS
jgi:hypothetical protein